MLTRPEQEGTGAFALVECQRAHPDYVSWLFGTPNGGMPEEFHGIFLPSAEGSDLRPRPVKAQLRIGAPVLLSWMEVRRNRKSGKRFSVPQTIENAAIQALKGTTGFAAEQFKQRSKVPYHNRVLFPPVIATTARLYTADYSPGGVELSSGTIAKDRVSLGDEPLPEKEPWVQLNYPAGETPASAKMPESLHATNPVDLDQFKQRTVFIVNSNKFVLFFNRLNQAVSGIRTQA